MTRLLPSLVLAALAAFACPDVARAATYWVDGDLGSDSNSGTSPTEAFQTFAHATAQLADGDCLTILEGNYPDLLELPVGVAYLTIRGEGRVVLHDPTRDGRHRLRGTTNRSLVLENLSIEDSENGVFLNGCFGAQARRLRFLRVGRAYENYRSSSHRLEGCVFVDCERSTSFQGDETVVGCTFKGCDYVLEEAEIGLRFQNNLIYECRIGVANTATLPLGALVSHNAIFELTNPSFLANRPGNVTSDPQLVDPDPRSPVVLLRPGSPLIDAGVDLEGQPTRQIGAGGVGYQAEQGSDPLAFATWRDGLGALVGASTRVELTALGEVRLRAGQTQAVLRSPAIDVAATLGSSGLRLKSIRFVASQSRSTGHVVDADPTSPVSEVRYRVSASPFAEGAALPAWRLASHGQLLLDADARYLQIEVTFRQP